MYKFLRNTLDGILTISILVFGVAIIIVPTAALAQFVHPVAGIVWFLVSVGAIVGNA